MNKTILLVEDSEDNRGLVREVVEEWLEGLTLLEAENGLDGVRMALASHPDLILLDMSLPLMNGWEVAARLKADATTAHIPIVALTAHAMDGDEAKALAAGCDAYVSKPISVVPFQALLQRYLESSPC